MSSSSQTVLLLLLVTSKVAMFCSKKKKLKIFFKRLKLTAQITAKCHTDEKQNISLCFPGAASDLKTKQTKQNKNHKKATNKQMEKKKGTKMLKGNSSEPKWFGLICCGFFFLIMSVVLFLFLPYCFKFQSSMRRGTVKSEKNLLYQESTYSKISQRTQTSRQQA